MEYKNLKIHSSSRKKYSSLRVLSGTVAPILLVTMLTGCFSNKNNHNRNHYRDYSNYCESLENSSECIEQEENINNTASIETENTNLSLELDSYSMSIINSKVAIDERTLDSFINYINNIEVSYPYSDLYGMQALLERYESLPKYVSTQANLFTGGKISVDTLYNIVKNNNKNASLPERKIMSDSDLKEVCSIIVFVLNDYVSNQKNADLNHLSEKINNLKILKFDDFSNGYYDATTGEMGFNVSHLKSKSYDFFKKTIEHETYHFIQASSLLESSTLGLADRYGISYKFFDVDVNALSWNWYYEGCAEYLTCNLNNTKDSDVYEALLYSIDTIKVSTILSSKNDVTKFENISLSNDLNELFEYFECKSKEDKLEVLNLMYAYNIMFYLNFSTDDFFDKCEEVYGEKLSKLDLGKQLNNSVAQTLTKQFYRDLAILLKNKEVNVKEIFALISVFENEISREIYYTSNQDTLTTFFQMYNETQSYFFEMISNKLQINVEDINQAYNSYNKEFVVQKNDLSLLDDSKSEFYSYIVRTREKDKMNSINYISEKYNSKKR